MLNPEVNAVINDIMTGDAKAVFLNCPAEYNRNDLLRELCNRHYKFFRFSPVNDDFSRLSVTIGERVLGKEDPRLPLIKGAESCAYGGTTAALSAVLKSVESENRAILFVFDSIDMLPEDYDYSAFIYLIKHAPSNLKIILSSVNCPKLDFTRLDPCFPQIISEQGLPLKRDVYTYEEYLSDLTADQKAFLAYVAAFPFVIGRIVESFLPGGEMILRYLARKGVYAYQQSAYGDEYYVMDRGLREYLLSAGYPAPDYADVTYEDRHFAYAIKTGALGRDITLALNARKFDVAEEIVEKGCAHDEAVFELYSYVKAHVDLICDTDMPDNAKGLNIMRALAHTLKGTGVYDVDMCLSLVLDIEREKDYLYYGALWILATALSKENDQDRVELFMGRVKEMLDAGTLDKKSLVLALTFTDNPLVRKLFTIADAENYLYVEGASKHLWYPKVAETVALQYYSAGNYRKAVQIADAVSKALPGYIEPAKISVAKFFLDGPERSIVSISEAINDARERDDYTELSLLYSIMAISAWYYGDARDMTDKMAVAMSFTSEKRDDESRFFTLMVKSLLLSLNGNARTALMLSKSSLAYAQEYCPKFVVQTATAVAYACYKSGANDEAYSCAKLAVQSSGGNRSCAWMLSMGIIANHLLASGDMSDIDSAVRNMLKVVDSHGLTMVVVSFSDDVFAPLLNYAKANGIAPEVIKKIETLAYKGKCSYSQGDALKVGMFGDVSISVGGKEIQWRTRKSKELFLHYVLAGEMGIDRNVIIDYLWKGYLYESAINNLKTTNNIIRNTLSAHNIEHKLQYVNSRYILSIENLDNDYDRYKKEINEYHKTDDVKRKVSIMDRILEIYKADLATDLSVPDFAHERISVKQEIIITLLKLVRALTKEKEYTEAKRFLGSLILIDKSNDYTAMASELDKFIRIIN